jgi:adenylate cyclase
MPVGRRPEPQTGDMSAPRGPMSLSIDAIGRRRVSRWLAAAAPIVLVSAFIAALVGAREQGWLQSAELFAYDVFLRLRSVPASTPEVAIIEVGDPALDEWGWPIPDGRLARLIDIANDAGAAAIALDIYRDRPVGAGHEEFVASLARAPVIGAMKFSDDGGAAVDPPPQLRKSGRFGVVDVPVDDDGVVRRALLYVDDGRTVFPSLALRATLDVLGAGGVRPTADPDDPGRMRLGRATLARLASDAGPYASVDSGGYQILLDVRRRDVDLPRLGAGALAAGEADASILAGKIVFIGITSELVKDLVVSPRGGDTASGLLHGVVLHAWLSDQLLRLARGEARLLDVPRPDRETAIIIAAGAAGLAIGMAIASPLALALAGLVIAAGAIGGSLVMFENDLWVPVVPGTAAALGSLAIAVGGRASAERRHRQALMQLFSQQVSPQIADDLWRRRDLILDRGLPRPLRLTATVMFMDLAGSTNIADRLEPDVYMAWVGRFLEQMAQTAIAGGGLVDKYTGDGLMVVFGVPIPRLEPREIDEDARAAVACALAMEHTLSAFNAEESSAGEVKARMRIGIHTGAVFAGCVGARQRAQYTVMGATVNAAARLEGLKELDDEEIARNADCRILISESTAALVRDAFTLREAGSVVLRGFSQPIAVYLVEKGASPSSPEE